jgi:hypothetical protein
MLYKIYNNTKYLNSFPKEWIIDNTIGTGPNYCQNCLKYGCIDDVFIGYCANCSEYAYNFQRGDGFEVSAEELILENNTVLPHYIQIEKFNIISHLQNKNNMFPSLFWNCNFCQSTNFNQNICCDYCNENKYKYHHNSDNSDNFIVNFNNISIN